MSLRIGSDPVKTLGVLIDILLNQSGLLGDCSYLLGKIQVARLEKIELDFILEREKWVVQICGPRFELRKIIKKKKKAMIRKRTKKGLMY